MKFAGAIFVFALCVLPAAVASPPARAADEPTIERLVTCRESWLDWADNPARGRKFVDGLHASYKQQEDGGYLVPKAKATLFGLPVARVYVDSVGMGVGFSVAVNATFDEARKVVEKEMGKALKCEAGNDEVRACQLELGPKRTVMVAADPEGSSTAPLIGCFYYYEK
jgi:hypothetical protein